MDTEAPSDIRIETSLHKNFMKYPAPGPKQDCFNIVKLYVGYLDVFWFAGNLVFVRWLCTVGKNRVANSNAAEVVKSLVQSLSCARPETMKHNFNKCYEKNIRSENFTTNKLRIIDW